MIRLAPRRNRPTRNPHTGALERNRTVETVNPALPGIPWEPKRPPPATSMAAMRPICFFVAGTPKTQGSMKAFVVAAKAGRKARAVLTHDSSKTKPWRKAIATEAAQHRYLLPGARPFDGPVSVSLMFFLARPTAHFGAHGVKASAPLWPATQRDDVDKLARATLDAVTGVLLVDDGQVVELHVRKRFGDGVGSGVRVELNPMRVEV